jgi:hypothetical protein
MTQIRTFHAGSSICVDWTYMQGGSTGYWIFLAKNSFPMKEWHAEHMEKTVLKYVRGLPENASTWEKKNYKKYGGLSNVCRQIEYDVKHGATQEHIAATFSKIRNDRSFAGVREDKGSMERLSQVEEHFIQPKIKPLSW